MFATCSVQYKHTLLLTVQYILILTGQKENNTQGSVYYLLQYKCQYQTSDIV